ncbi:MAG: GNAT family N-acetyltransferase [Bacteroidetes bacterium]|nr:MAG: GNAT family N-acetyltransferase [Bacteroidota bacterium]
MKTEWSIKSFDELTSLELYKIIQLRIEVFVVEQNCPFQDADNKDQTSWHFMGWQSDQLVAYTRIVPPGLAFSEPSIGRVVTSKLVRGTGMGRILMEKSMEELYKLYPSSSIKIGAQLYLKTFYESLGFVTCSDIYLEDGIEHIYMIKA